MTSDEASILWERFRCNGDEAAFNRLYREYGPRVTRYCRARIAGHDDESAVEIADRLLAYLYRARPASRHGFEAMLFHYAGLWCKDYRRPLCVPALRDDIADPRAVDPPGAALVKDRDQRIHQAVDDLPPLEREIVLRHFLERIPLGIVARSLEITRFRAYRLLHNALRTLRTRFKGL